MTNIINILKTEINYNLNIEPVFKYLLNQEQGLSKIQAAFIEQRVPKEKEKNFFKNSTIPEKI